MAAVFCTQLMTAHGTGYPRQGHKLRGPQAWRLAVPVPPTSVPDNRVAWASPGVQISSSSPKGLARKEGPKATRAPEANSRALG